MKIKKSFHRILGGDQAHKSLIVWYVVPCKIFPKLSRISHAVNQLKFPKPLAGRTKLLGTSGLDALRAAGKDLKPRNSVVHICLDWWLF